MQLDVIRTISVTCEELLREGEHGGRYPSPRIHPPEFGDGLR
jgi:hypothetical protein